MWFGSRSDWKSMLGQAAVEDVTLLKLYLLSKCTSLLCKIVLFTVAQAAGG
jgi:hypothetical protein